jgi:hypothetical protein
MHATALVTLMMMPSMFSGDGISLEYAPAPVDNPLRGLVPYQGDVRSIFPHSLEFNYLPLSALMKGYDHFDWTPLESFLEDVASRGHQAIFRIFLEFPGKQAIPEFLVADGLKIHRWVSGHMHTSPLLEIETPDYEDTNLRKSLQAFIAALGKKYDGDPRIGFITAGLLGTWGEWHTYPKSELFASKAVQAEVMDAYEAAFKITPVLMRYPAGESNLVHAPNAVRHFGFHDDSFAWATLDSGEGVQDWYFVRVLKAAGPEAVQKWKTHPIGGEIRPEAWGKVFDEHPGHRQIQNFRMCVNLTHVTWLMDSGMFTGKQPEGRIKRAEAEVRRMGYEFHSPRVTIGAPSGGTFTVAVEVENRGVAPFYYDWKPQFGLILDRKVVKTIPAAGALTGLLPGDPPRIWRETLDVSGTKPGTYKLALRVPNSLMNGHPLKFANATQDSDADGWLTLGSITVE